MGSWVGFVGGVRGFVRFQVRVGELHFWFTHVFSTGKSALAAFDKMEEKVNMMEADT